MERHKKTQKKKNSSFVLLTNFLFFDIVYTLSAIRKLKTDAVVAQSVERRLGKAEVTGSNPVNSFFMLGLKWMK